MSHAGPTVGAAASGAPRPGLRHKLKCTSAYARRVQPKAFALDGTHLRWNCPAAFEAHPDPTPATSHKGPRPATARAGGLLARRTDGWGGGRCGRGPAWCRATPFIAFSSRMFTFPRADPPQRNSVIFQPPDGLVGAQNSSPSTARISVPRKDWCRDSGRSPS